MCLSRAGSRSRPRSSTVTHGTSRSEHDLRMRMSHPGRYFCKQGVRGFESPQLHRTDDAGTADGCGATASRGGSCRAGTLRCAMASGHLRLNPAESRRPMATVGVGPIVAMNIPSSSSAAGYKISASTQYIRNPLAPGNPQLHIVERPVRAELHNLDLAPVKQGQSDLDLPGHRNIAEYLPRHRDRWYPSREQ